MIQAQRLGQMLSGMGAQDFGEKRIGAIVYLVLARDVVRKCRLSSVKVSILGTLIMDIFALDQ
jgi:hypothetical protein